MEDSKSLLVVLDGVNLLLNIRKVGLSLLPNENLS
uniref:Uncharacterized protein n=1 Tax=Rhizophora mucronata TaxID=61149 RepID=A0A2P2PK52_RHIMU